METSHSARGSQKQRVAQFAIPLGALAVFITAFLLVSCSASPTGKQANLQPNPETTAGSSETDRSEGLPLRTVADIPLTGGPTRLDYQSLDSVSGRLYIAHLGSDLLTVFDVNKQTIIGDVKDLKRIHGVLAVPELHRVYASATGTNELAIIDDNTLQVVERARAGDYPDGDVYEREANQIYVSPLRGTSNRVIAGEFQKRLTTI